MSRLQEFMLSVRPKGGDGAYHPPTSGPYDSYEDTPVSTGFLPKPKTRVGQSIYPLRAKNMDNTNMVKRVNAN